MAGLLGLLLLMAPTPAEAQNGILFVRVSSPTGPVANASVQLLLQDQVIRDVGTDLEGVARIGGLPGGTFALRVEALGFTVFTLDEVRVDPSSARAVDVGLVVAPIELEGITIRAERVQIERENTEFSTRVDEAAILLLPMTHDVSDLVALTPGARPGHIWGGANFQANSYRLDGLSVNHPGRGGEALQPNINWIDRMEVRGLGAGAEYGGFQGGLVDVVTKQGSNKFEGSVRSTYEHDALNARNLVRTEVGTEVVGRYDVEGEVRGPLIQDRLFYYLSGKRVGQDRHALNHLPHVDGQFAPFFEERTEDKLFGKLTWNPGPTHILEVSGAYTDTRADNYELTGFEAAGATHRYSSPTWFLNASAQEFLGSWGALEARVNHFSRDERFDPYQGSDVPGLSTFSLTPPYTAYGNAPVTLRSAPSSTSATVIGTLRLRTGELEHSLKIGGEYNRGTFLDRRIRNGGLTWRPVKHSGFDPSDPATWVQPATSSRRIVSEWGGEVQLDADVDNAAAFAQSAIALGPRIVLSPGIRWNQWKGWITPTSGERFLAVQDQGLDPRVGLSVDLTGDGTLVAKAHWGRYHQNIISQMFDRVAGADVFTNEEYWYYQGERFTDPTTTFTQAERNSLAQQGLFIKQGEIILNETGPVMNYRQPYVDQWLVGLEKQVGNWLKFEALYTRRSNRDMVALVDLNRATNYTRFEKVRVYDPSGIVVPFAGGSVYLQELYVPNNLILERLRCKAKADCPDAPMVPGLTYADTLNLSWNPNFVLTTAPDGKRDFNQFQFSLEVAQPLWGATFSFVQTHLEGNLDNVSGYTDPEGYGAGPYVRVNEGINSFGTLENFADREWKVSVWGVMPYQLRGGLFWTFQSGDHYSPQFRLYGIGFFNYRVNTGVMTPTGVPQYPGQVVDYSLMWPLEGHEIFVGPRGRPTLGRRNILDLRLERMFRVRGFDLAVSVDVFNILRNEAITQLNTMVNNGPDYGFATSPSLFVPAIEPNLYYQAPLERVPPRTIRLGMAWYF
ncbi:carboxypeptidase regulatory-like domain-containing protein [Gemmatimonadota bacterium]